MPDFSSATFLNSVQVPATSTTRKPNASASTGTSTATGNQLGKQDFLKLLMAQMQNQDPLKPMDNQQMISQMAQFSALEATQALNATIQQSANVQTVAQAGSLIGKYILSKQSDGSSISGAVTGVTFTTTNGVVTPTVLVNGKNVDYSTIVQISSTPIAQA